VSENRMRPYLKENKCIVVTKTSKFSNWPIRNKYSSEISYCAKIRDAPKSQLPKIFSVSGQNGGQNMNTMAKQRHECYSLLSFKYILILYFTNKVE